MYILLCFHTFSRLCVASWPLQFISLCWQSFAGFFFMVYESMAKSRKSLPRISTLRSFMSSLDGVSSRTSCLRYFSPSVSGENDNTRVYSSFKYEMQELSVFNQSVLQKNSQSSEIALHHTPIIAYYRFLRLTYLYIIYINDSLLPAQH